jgi:hypothetical protein
LHAQVSHRHIYQLGWQLASHQIGWTGLVAKTIQFYGLLDPKRILEAGKQAAFHSGPPRRGRVKSAVPLADRAIGTFQQWWIGTYHGVSKAQLQAYLQRIRVSTQPTQDARSRISDPPSSRNQPPIH